MREAGSRRRGSCFSYFALNFLCATMLKTPFFSPSGHRLLLRPFPYQSHGPHSLSKFSQFAHTHTHMQVCALLINGAAKLAAAFDVSVSGKTMC